MLTQKGKQVQKKFVCNFLRRRHVFILLGWSKSRPTPQRSERGPSRFHRSTQSQCFFTPLVVTCSFLWSRFLKTGSKPYFAPLDLCSLLFGLTFCLSPWPVRKYFPSFILLRKNKIKLTLAKGTFPWRYYSCRVAEFWYFGTISSKVRSFQELVRSLSGFYQ